MFFRKLKTKNANNVEHATSDFNLLKSVKVHYLFDMMDK